MIINVFYLKKKLDKIRIWEQNLAAQNGEQFLGDNMKQSKKLFLPLIIISSALLGACATQHKPITSTTSKHAHIKKTNLNTASEKTLRHKAHLSKAQAQAIIEYRKHHGHIKSWKQLGNLKGKGYHFSKTEIETLKHNTVL